MSTIDRMMGAAGLLAVGLLASTAIAAVAADEEPNAELVQMIAELVSDSDRDMRALGLQQVREEVPGEAATKQFAELLPKLPPEGQAGLLEALGDRQDSAALPAVLESLKSDQEAVRAAALSALGSLGGKDQVGLLAEKAAAGSDAEKAAARQSLVRLRGEGVNEAIQSALADGAPDVRVALLGVLAARNAKQALPAVLESAGDAEPAIRLAALRAVRYLADEDDTAKVVDLLKRASNSAERRAAQLALLTISSRGREACSEAVAAGLADADVPSRMVLLEVLARAGGPKALEAVTASLDDKSGAVRTAAVRMLSRWPTSEVLPTLKKLAQSDDQMKRVLAVRGLVRLASPEEDKPADMATLTEAMKLAERPAEKRMVLGVLGGIPTAESFALAAAALDDPAVADEAGLAVALIAPKMPKDDAGEVKAVLERVLKVAKNESVRQQAQQALESL